MASHKLIETIDTEFPLDGVIVEIGSARETSGAESSTFYFNELAKQKGLDFFSVDFSPESHALASEVIAERAILSDGAMFLRRFRELSDKRISVLYLDNFDVVYSPKHFESLMRRVGNIYNENNEELNNERSAAVHLEQMKEALPLMAHRHIVIIDDTMMRESGWWGKGASTVPFLLELGYSLLTTSEDGVLLVNPETK